MRIGILKACLLSLGLMMFAGSARAEEWRYCLALSEAARRVYMSSPFQCAVDMSKLERMLRNSLTRAGVSVDSVQCPRGSDERGILAMRDHAIAFNRQAQMSVVDVGWRPGAGAGCEQAPAESR
ncbi:hypothetical protein [Bradyrhizobium sp.]|uniref:hypothetical protein n=1 Tax=Bradyrhizobium sp. TaxID=376 RepID=UPI0039E6AE09